MRLSHHLPAALVHLSLRALGTSHREVVAVFAGVLELDLLLGDVRSLKEKRAVVRPVVAELRRKLSVSAAEAGHLDLHRRALVGVAVVAADAGHCREVLDACERLVADRPELEVLSARQRLFGEDD
jgi:uncharacterized protein YlxP (DUF503 family)